MKKFFSTLLILTLFISCLSFISCSKDDNTPTYTVTFGTKGGSQVSSQEVKEGEKATRPEDPTKDGYDFVGWYLQGVLYDFNTPVVADITLVAEWQQKSGTGSGSVEFPWVDLPLD